VIGIDMVTARAIPGKSHFLLDDLLMMVTFIVEMEVYAQQCRKPQAVGSPL
jgi:hypothetical protein